MSGQLTQFRIEALHNIRTIDVQIVDNKLVLVGENGTGKSTVANFIYFFLTRQWHRMLGYKFRSIVAVVNSQEIEISRDDLVSSVDAKDIPIRLRRRFPLSVLRRIESLIREYSPEELIDHPDIVSQFAAESNIPHSLVEDYIVRRVEDLTSSDKLAKIEQTLMDAITDQILYLPTYRRIERDLRSIFPELESGTRDFRGRSGRREGSRYIELVEFGMKDVEQTIQRRMNEIKDNVRDSLNNLTGAYLRDVIRKAYRSTDLLSELRELDEATVNAIFNRISEAILPEQDQQTLRATITKIRETSRIDDEDQVVAHFLTRLIELHKAQQEEEKDVKEFVKVCNRYLLGQEKEMVYDSLSFDISILERRRGGDSQKLSMRMLSSGEKQIVSLFSHMYLSKGTGHFIIIDEPELSLSVPWQKRFLPDILETKRCNGLIAVTHSPFVYDNDLEEYVHSLEEFTEVVNVVPR